MDDLFKDMNRVIKCLALELPESVWNDVDKKYRELVKKVKEKLNSNKE